MVRTDGDLSDVLQETYPGMFDFSIDRDLFTIIINLESGSDTWTVLSETNVGRNVIAMRRCDVEHEPIEDESGEIVDEEQTIEDECTEICTFREVIDKIGDMCVDWHDITENEIQVHSPTENMDIRGNSHSSHLYVRKSSVWKKSELRLLEKKIKSQY